MVTSAGKLGDVLCCERFDDSGVEDSSFIFTCTFLDTGLPKAIQTPTVNFAVLVDCEGVEGTAGDMDDTLGKAKQAGLEAMETGAFNNAASKLVLLSRTPGEDGTLVVQGQDVVVAANNLLDLLETRNEAWLGLNLVLRVESQDSFVALIK